MKPLAIDLFCGLGGFTSGALAAGYDCIGFDIEQHVYGEHRYPAQLVVQDVLTLHGSQFRDAALIVASPPCQEFSWARQPRHAAGSTPQHAPSSRGPRTPRTCWPRTGSPRSNCRSNEKAPGRSPGLIHRSGTR